MLAHANRSLQRIAVKIQGKDSVFDIKVKLGHEYRIVGRLGGIDYPNLLKVYGKSIRKRTIAPFALSYLYTEWVHESPSLRSYATDCSL